MSRKIRLIDATALEGNFKDCLDDNSVLPNIDNGMFNCGVIKGVEFCLRLLQRATTVNPDRPIMRCRDCKHKERVSCENTVMCRFLGRPILMNGSGYCYRWEKE